MIIKKNTHHAVITNYFFAEGKERNHYNTGTNIFYEDDALYSYGRHYELAVRCQNAYILNKDYYSGGTSGHQNSTSWKASQHQKETGAGKLHHCCMSLKLLGDILHSLKWVASTYGRWLLANSKRRITSISLKTSCRINIPLHGNIPVGICNLWSLRLIGHRGLISYAASLRAIVTVAQSSKHIGLKTNRYSMQEVV